MKTSLYLCLSLASVLSAPSLFASPHAFEDQENVVPRQVRLADGSLKHIKLHAHHLKSSPTSQAELMHMHAVHKDGRLASKLVGAHITDNKEAIAAIAARLSAHKAEVARLAAQHAQFLAGGVAHAPVGLAPSVARQTRIDAIKAGAIPVTKIDLSAGQLILDQEQLGSCTAHGTTACINQSKILVDKATGKIIHPSRLAIYLRARVHMGIGEGSPSKYVQQDSGAAIADAAIGATAAGNVPPESMWPYSDSTVTGSTLPPFETQPGEECGFAGAALLKTSPFVFAKVDASTAGIIDRLKKGSYVVFGMTLHQSFEENVGLNGVVPVPGTDVSDPIVGGHCMAVCGYFPNMKGNGVNYFKVQNSWGTSWGQNGFCYIPVSMFNKPDTLGDMWYVAGAKAAKAKLAAIPVAS